MVDVLIVVGKIVLAITVFDILVVLGLMASLRIQRSTIRDAPFLADSGLALSSPTRRVHNHRLPLQDGWTRDETIAWAKAGHDFPDRLFNLHQMIVVIDEGEECAICVGRTLRSFEVARHQDAASGVLVTPGSASTRGRYPSLAGSFGPEMM